MAAFHLKTSAGSREPIELRPIEGEAEFDAFFRLAAATFAADLPEAAAIAGWRHLLLGGPGAGRVHFHGAFRDGAYVGGYALEERVIRIGEARIKSGFIGAVVTHPDHRRQGIAGALMRDALRFAQSHGIHALMLYGLADFYDQFGYVDMFDPVEVAVEVAGLDRFPSSPFRVRAAVPADAARVVDLHRRHYGPYAGTTERSIEDQAFLIGLLNGGGDEISRDAGENFVIAEDEAGVARGYRAVPWGHLGFFGIEVAADDWAALLALGHHDAARLAAVPDPPAALRWPLPQDAPMFFELADHVRVELHSSHRPRAGWMARVVDLPGMVAAMEPEWSTRWLRTGRAETGSLALEIDGRPWILDLIGGGVKLRNVQSVQDPDLRLSLGQWTQVVFGFRPIEWVARQIGASASLAALPLLGTLFPPIHSWIAPMDGF